MVLLAPFLGGSTQRWSQGVVLVLLGLLLVLKPSSSFGSRTILSLFAGLLALAMTGFLPAHWFRTPAWRSGLVETLGIRLPFTLSPQPWLTMDGVILLCAGLAWIGWLHTRSWNVDDQRWMFKRFAFGLSVFAGFALLVYYAGFSIPFWLKSERMFGPFPNRNQTANFFALGAILTVALVYENARAKKIVALGWVFALWVTGTALVFNYSRAGIALFFAGTFLWLVLLCFFSRSAKRIATSLTILLVLGAAFLLFGGETLGRFQAGGPGGMLGYRAAVYRDAFGLISSSPWCGVGLGNFDALFALFRDASVNQSRIIHPESDWLWLWSEMGLPAIILVLAAFAALVRQIFPLQQGTNRRLRAAGLAAAVIFACHSVVDVSGHRLGSMLPALFIFGLALHPRKPWREDRLAPAFWRVAGFMIAAVGFAWIAAVLGEWPFPGEIAAAVTKAKAKKLAAENNFTATIPAATAALTWRPLDWGLFFARGAAEAYSGKLLSAAADFRRARTLEHCSPEIAIHEGSIWLACHPGFALAPWSEALRRSEPEEAVSLYSRILHAASEHPALMKQMRALAGDNPRFEAVYLAVAPPEEFDAVLHSILRTDPSLHLLHDNEQAALFSRWAAGGDSGSFLEQLARNSSWQRNGWLAAAGIDVRRGDFESACHTARKYLQPPALPTRILADAEPKLQRRLFQNPGDFSVGYALYNAQMKSGQESDALVTLEKLVAQPGCPPYFLYLEADHWEKRHEWKKAWEALNASAVAGSRPATAPSR